MEVGRYQLGTHIYTIRQHRPFFYLMYLEAKTFPIVGFLEAVPKGNSIVVSTKNCKE